MMEAHLSGGARTGCILALAFALSAGLGVRPGLATDARILQEDGDAPSGEPGGETGVMPAGATLCQSYQREAGTCIEHEEPVRRLVHVQCIMAPCPR